MNNLPMAMFIRYFRVIIIMFIIRHMVCDRTETIIKKVKWWRL